MALSPTLTGTETAEADRIQARRKAKKEQQIREKNKAELATLRTDFLFSTTGAHFFTSLSVVAQGLPESRSPPRIPDLSSSIHVVSSDSDSDVNETSSPLVLKLPSSTPRQSGRTRKPTRKLEAQKRGS